MSKKYFIKNKYVGVKVAKYSQQKDRLHKMQQRRKDEVELIESKIDEEQKAIASLEEEKAKAICAGDQNEFLIIADELRKSKDSLEYYCERKKKAAELAKIKPAEVIDFINSTMQEQKRLNSDAIKWLQEQIKGIYYMLEQVKRDLEEGDILNNKAMNLYLKDASPAEAEEIKKSIVGYNAMQHRFNYFHNNGVLEKSCNSLQEQIEYFESDDLKEYFEEKYTDIIS